MCVIVYLYTCGYMRLSSVADRPESDFLSLSHSFPLPNCNLKRTQNRLTYLLTVFFSFIRFQLFHYLSIYFSHSDQSGTLCHIINKNAFRSQHISYPWIGWAFPLNLIIFDEFHNILVFFFQKRKHIFCRLQYFNTISHYKHKGKIVHNSWNPVLWIFLKLIQ